MVLLPQQSVDEVMRRHRAALGLVHGYLDLSVSRAFVRLNQACRPEWRRGPTLSGLVRNIFLDLANNPVMQASSLSLVERPNVGLRLIDRSGLKMRVRRWPSDVRSHRPVPVTQPPVETLFGVDWDAAPFELIVLWRPDWKGEVLGSVSLAAVAHIDEPHRVAIYAESALPLATSGTLQLGPFTAQAPAAALEEAYDFEDGEWPDQVAETGGPDSA